MNKWKKSGQNAPESNLIIYRKGICWKVLFAPAHRTTGISRKKSAVLITFRVKKCCTYNIPSGILSREDVNGL